MKRSTHRWAGVTLGAAVSVLAFCGPALAQSQYFPITPCRLYDSRSDGPATPVTAQVEPGRQLTVRTNCGIPGDATAVSYNVTVVTPGGNGFLTLYPAGTSLPTVSAINFQTGDVRGNGGVVPLGAGDPDLNVYVATDPPGLTSHFVLDATGYFREPAP